MKVKGPWTVSGALIEGSWSVKLRLESLAITRRAESLGANSSRSSPLGIMKVY